MFFKSFFIKIKSIIKSYNKKQKSCFNNVCFRTIETKEAVDKKIRSRSIEFLPFSQCISTTTVDTESDRGDVSFFIYNHFYQLLKIFNFLNCL